MLISARDEETVAKRGNKHETDTDTDCQTEPETGRHSLGFCGKRFRNRREDDLEEASGEQCPDRIDEHALRLENGPHSRLQSHIPQERSDDGRASYDDETSEEQCQIPPPRQHDTGEERRTDQRDDRTNRDETSDRRLLPFEARPFKVETAFKQDDRDAKVDGGEQPVPQRAWFDQRGKLRTEERTGQQQKHDPWYPDLAG